MKVGEIRHQIEDICEKYLGKHLTSWDLLKTGLAGRQFTLTTKMKLKGILLENLLKKLKPKESNNQDVYADAIMISRYLQFAYECEEELKQ